MSEMTTKPFGDESVCHADETPKALHCNTGHGHSIVKVNQLMAQKNFVCTVLCASSHLPMKFSTQSHRRIIEPLRLEKTFKIIESNHSSMKESMKNHP